MLFSMIVFVYPQIEKIRRMKPVTLEIGEIEDYDFAEVSIRVFEILTVLGVCNIISVKYDSAEEALDVICRLVADIDLDSDKLQISEFGNIRVEFRDDLLSLEIYISV